MAKHKKFVKMTSYAKCKKYTGVLIKCPECNHIARVYRLSWCALSCVKCKKANLKVNWLIEKS